MTNSSLVSVAGVRVLGLAPAYSAPILHRSVALVRVGGPTGGAVSAAQDAADAAVRTARTKEMAVVAGIGALVGGVASKFLVGGALGPIAIGIGAGALLGAGLDEVYNVVVRGQGW